jgi:DNA-binding transcriptional ArsR family regulator
MDELIKLQLLFQNLSDTNRLKILKQIGDRECSVSEIVNSTGLSQPLISHHLRTLRENNILEAKRTGPFVYYRIKDPRLLSALGIFLEIAGSMDDIERKNPTFPVPPWWRMYWNNGDK